MKLRTKYILFVVIIHLITLVFSYYIFGINKIFFIISEVFVIISIVIAWQLYVQLLQPLKTLMQGVEAIKDRDFNVKLVSTGKHEMDQLIGVYNRMMDELRIERTRQEQQHFFLEKLIFTSPTGIVILDFDGNIQQINPRALQILTVDAAEIIGYPVDKHPHPLLEKIKELKSGETMTFKMDGISTYMLQKSHFIDRGFSRHFVMMEDLTAEIVTAEKNVYGKVIRMMAHEVNNTVGPVNSIIQSALRTQLLWENHQFDNLKNALQVATQRNQNLNRFMRSFADLVKLPAANKRLVDLHQLIISVSKLLEIRAAESDVEFEFNFMDGPFSIMADEQQMEQVLINIIKNAIEAIGEHGKVGFKTSHGCLVISDTGVGISSILAADLFSPFFSTKKDGQGIGLTLVREILFNHGFEFSLKSVTDNQTEFSIYF